jgi:hypothetical protein
MGYRRKVYMSGGYFVATICYICYGQLVWSISDAFVVGIVMNICLSLSQAVLDAAAIDKLKSQSSASDNDEAAHTRGSCDIQSAAMTFRTMGSLVSYIVAGAISSTGVSERTLVTCSAVFPFTSFLIVTFCSFDTKHSALAPVYEKTQRFFKYMITCVRECRYPKELIATVKPVVLPCIFILLYASCPSSNVVFVNYLYNLSAFDQWQFHVITLCGLIGALVGTLSYWKGFRNVGDIRIVFTVSVFVSIVATCSRLLIVHGWDMYWFICVDESFVNLAARFTLMPVQVYASIAATSPEHLMYEGFIFGLFASIENWGGTISGLISSAIAEKVSLVNMIIISSCTSIAPLFALSLLRCDRTNKSEKTEPLATEPAAKGDTTDAII